MRKTLSFIKLDFITIKPYLTLKNLIIFAVIMLCILITSGTIAAIVGLVAFLCVTYVSYPFAVGEQRGIDALYITLAIPRKTVVRGRYLFAIATDLSAIALSFVVTFLMSIVSQKPFAVTETVLVALIAFFMLSLTQTLQLPIYFKLGYTKAKVLAYAPFVLWTLIPLLFTGVISPDIGVTILNWLKANTYLSIGLCLAAWCAAFLASYTLSTRFYKAREF